MADVLHINMGFLIENILEKLGTQIDIWLSNYKMYNKMKQRGKQVWCGHVLFLLLIILTLNWIPLCDNTMHSL
jgi:hypothetical protein